MFNYKGETCPYCEKSFHADDDIAVCPECGAPHHRECYADFGRCAHAARHEAGFDWSIERKARNLEIGATAFVTCPHCGRSIFSESRFCNYCGNQFERNVQPIDQQEVSQPLFIFGPRDDAEEPSGQIDVKEFDGIPVADWLKYIGRNAVRYLIFFSQQDRTGRKTSFTLSAALFPSIYFLYRKMWLWAAVAATLSLTFYFPTIVLYLSKAGINLGFDLGVLTTIETYFYYISLGVSLIWGMFAMYFYRHTAARRIRRIKLNSASEQAYQSGLERASGPSLVAALLPPAAVLLGMTLLNLLGWV